jgi:glyoxylase-like metal-dependent hydrolase (beta-lactamase superfamily II)
MPHPSLALARPRRGRLLSPTPLVLCALLATVVGCGNDSEDDESGTAPAAAPSDTAPLAVERIASANPGSVNTYWFAGPDGLVVVDTQRSLTDARAALDAVRAGGEPVAAVLLTHGHPDHVGGVGVFRDAYPGVPVHASEGTRDFMRDDPLGFFALTRQLPGSDYAPELPLPDHLVEPGATVDAGGLVLETAEFGPGESAATTVYHEPDSGALFVGDLVNNEATPALVEGNTCGWLTNLDRLAEEFPGARTLYPGHGAPGDPGELIGRQRDYLLHVRDLVRPAVAADSPGAGELTDEERAAAVAALEAAHPGHQPVATLPDLHGANVDAVAGELRAEDAAALPAVCREGGA